MATTSPPSASALAMMLSNAQNGDRDAQRALAKMPWLKRLVHARCSKCGVGSQDEGDVLQETLTRLLDPERQRFSEYLTKRAGRGPGRRRVGSNYGPAHDYVGGTVWNAIGLGKRRRYAATHVSRTVETSSADEGQVEASRVEAVVMDGVGSPAAMEARVAAREVLSAMPPNVRKLATAVYCEGMSGTEFEADPDLAMDKVQVSRALARFRVEARGLLAA